MRAGIMGFLIVMLAVPAAAQGNLLGADVMDSYVKPHGAYLNVVAPSGSVGRAGLLSGDVIMRIDGKPVAGAQALERALARHHAGDKVRIDVTHLGKMERITLVLRAAAGKTKPAAVSNGYVARSKGLSGALSAYDAALRSTPDNSPQVRAHQHAPAPLGGGAPFITPASGQTAGRGGTGQERTVESVRWTRYRDPSDGAFTIEVPAGWRVSGESRRVSVPDVRFGVQAVSPDGSITLFYGDLNISIFSLPNQLLYMGGLRPGMGYDLGQGVRTLIEPYTPGTVFAASWGRQRIAQGCSNVTLVGNRARPDSNRAIDHAYASAGIMHSVQAGEASFHCILNGAPAGGYVFASTELVRSQMGGLWDVNSVMGIIATAPRAAEASLLLSHMSKSFTVDPGWLQRNAELNAQFGRIVQATDAAVSARIAANGRAAEQMSDMIFKGGQARAKAEFQTEENYDYFAVRGTSDYVDRNTGTVYPDVSNEHAHVFLNTSTNQVIPTDSENRPCQTCVELQQVPAGH